ncbi:transketolase C-terminal domain-containing protein [Euzebya tangerina]|uniref:transketolase C-terminal domain-containing protein n=1 Tax=Euzebya tangerina TaxID=591198 RepID=UPI000E3240C0|nr:transketolase C-terminal domain-containing protein [Euzebya tangerina]
MLAETIAGTHRTVTAPFAEALVAAGRRHDDLVVLSADLSKWTDVLPFAQSFGDRFIQVGMAEQNLIGIAGGLAKAGWRPVVVGFGVFLTRRAYDQISMSLATGPSNAVIVGFLPGVTSRFRGTHQAIEDAALMRAVPGMRVLDPADATELRQALDTALDRGGLTYIRAMRGQVPLLFDDPTPELPSHRVLADGAHDVAVVSTGLATTWVREARELGAAAAHLHVASLKPFPAQVVADLARSRRRVITVENHVRHAGLGAAVALALADHGVGVPVTRLGLSDAWQAYGTPDYVRDQAGLSPTAIAEVIRGRRAIAPAGHPAQAAPQPIVAWSGHSHDLARRIRHNVVHMCRRRGQGYAGQGLQLADVMAVVFADVLRHGADGQPTDRFVLSTGHSAIALYATLGALGVYDDEQLATYGADGSAIEESPLEDAPGFEVTGGSLGQGPSQAVGIALGERSAGRDVHVICQLSDGELDEGAVWEAFMAAAHHQLANLTFFVDYNGEQADGAIDDVMGLEPVVDKLTAFGLHVQRLDGHDHDALRAAFATARSVASPAALVLDTVPGRGAPTLEAHEKVHYVRVDDDVWAQALAEVAP